MNFLRLFPEVPEDLTALSDEGLSDLLSSFRGVSGQLRAGEIDLAAALVEGDELPDGVGAQDLSDEAMRQWQDAAGTVREIRALQASRAEARENFDSQAAEIDAEFAGDDDEPDSTTDADPDAVVAEGTETAADESNDDDETGGDGDGEADEATDADADSTATASNSEAAVTVTAAAGPRPVLYPSIGARHTVPVDNSDSRELAVVAAGGNSNARINAGERLDRNAYADALVRLARSLGPVTKVQGGRRDRFLVASAHHVFDEGMRLVAGDPEGNAVRIARATGNPFLGEASRQARAEAALTADGGICAPPVPLYTLPSFGVTSRPVRDFIPSFNADRGGVSIPGVTTIADYADAETDGGVTVIEADEDALGGTFATKSCAAMDCPEWTDVFVGIVSHCRQFGNLNSRTWPEGVAHENDNTMVLLSRVAEGRLLDRVDALSVPGTGLATYGAASTLLYNLTLARSGMISLFRLDPGTRVQAILPFWAADMFAMDLMNGQYDRFVTPAGRVGALLAQYGIDVGWHLDQGLDGSAPQEVWDAQTDSADVPDWPTANVRARVFLPGTFIHLDGGDLELGLVRDSDLNHQNNYELFGELFENVGRIGPAQAARVLDIAVCPDGTVAAPTTAFTCNPS